MTRQELLFKLFNQFRDQDTPVEEKEWAVGLQTKVAPLNSYNGYIALHQLVDETEYCLRLAAAKVTAFRQDEEAILKITTHFNRGLIIRLGGISGLDLRTMRAVRDLMPVVIALLTAAVNGSLEALEVT